MYDIYIGDASLKKMVKDIKKSGVNLFLDPQMINQSNAIVKTDDEKGRDIISRINYAPMIRKLCNDEKVFYRQVRAASMDSANNIPEGSPPVQECVFHRNMCPHI